MPRITVIMPVYNCEAYVSQAIESILQQTFGDFELLVIDDASTDRTVDAVRSFSDPRIRLIKKPVNTGYTHSLNMGIGLASGEFIARMDGDDISKPYRFQKQVALFEQHPNVVLCGGSMEVIDSSEIVSLPVSHDEIKITLLKYCCMAHPSIMMRRNFLQQHQLQYNHNKEPAEDYDLWVRMIQKGEAMNLAESLIGYRVHENQTSQKRLDRQRESAMQTRIAHLSALIPVTDATHFYSILQVIAQNDIQQEFDFLQWLQKENQVISNRNSDLKLFHPVFLDKFLQEHLKIAIRTVFLHSKKYTPVKLISFLKYARKFPGSFTTSELIKNTMKCLLFHSIR